MSGYYYTTIDPQIVSAQPSLVSYDPHHLYGYNLLSNIYGNIIETLGRYPSYNLDITSTTEQSIRNKLVKLRSLEEEIKEAIKNAELKQYLQSASRGIIDPARIPDDKLPQILQKHSNLLGLTTTYNAKVMNLANMLQKINDVLVYRSGNPKYGLSMSIKYPTYPQASYSPSNVPWIY